MYAASPHGAARLPLMNTSARPADGAEDQKQYQKPEPEPDQKIAAFGSS
jgi:hypothetical protein